MGGLATGPPNPPRSSRPGEAGALLETFGRASLTYFKGAYRQLDPDPEYAGEALWDLLARSGY